MTYFHYLLHLFVFTFAASPMQSMGLLHKRPCGEKQQQFSQREKLNSRWVFDHM